jgi:sulfur-oxidizing protein SoxY
MVQATRRHVLTLTAGAVAAFAGGAIGIAPARADEEAFQTAIRDFTGGVEPQAGRVTLTLPDAVENGSSVPVSVAVESAMSDGDLVEEVAIFADGNPLPGVAAFAFTARSGVASAGTRIRLAQSQTVVAVARFADGSVFMDSRAVEVTVGGCAA